MLFNNIFENNHGQNWLKELYKISEYIILV